MDPAPLWIRWHLYGSPGDGGEHAPNSIEGECIAIGDGARGRVHFRSIIALSHSTSHIVIEAASVTKLILLANNRPALSITH